MRRSNILYNLLGGFRIRPDTTKGIVSDMKYSDKILGCEIYPEMLPAHDAIRCIHVSEYSNYGMEPQSERIFLQSNSCKTLEKKQHVKFNQNENKILYINGKDFYKQNNIKNKMWWSTQELTYIRDMFMIEVKRIKNKYPHKTQRECMLELLDLERTNI